MVSFGEKKLLARWLNVIYFDGKKVLTTNVLFVLSCKSCTSLILQQYKKFGLKTTLNVLLPACRRIFIFADPNCSGVAKGGGGPPLAALYGDGTMGYAVCYKPAKAVLK